MRSVRLIICLVMMACMPVAAVHSQQKPGKPVAKQPPAPVASKAKLLLAGRAAKDQIILRWAPDHEIAWKLANQYGYIVERFTISRNDSMLKKIERIASRGLIKPAPLAKWDSIANKNDYAAVIAQAIYGDDFEVSVSDNQGVAKFVNETEQLRQRYTMSLYAADHSFDAARYAGLAWVDRNVKPNEKYLYRVYTVVPKTKIIIDTALVYIGLADYKPLPKPSDIYADFGDKNVILSWDFDSYKDYYNSYYVEKSADGGKTFSKATDLPVTKLNEAGNDSTGKQPGIVLFMDSLANNKTDFSYRIAGVTAFGETGPYSEIITGKGRTMLPGTPHITGISINEKEKMELNWFFEDSLSSLIKGFELRAAEKVDGEYKVVQANIASSERKVLLEEVASSSYMMVTAVPVEGEPRSSYPYLVQPEDSLPPVVPQDFTGTVDTSGVVTLKWKANTEKDLLGYKIFRTYVRGHEYSTVMDSVWKQAEYRDTLNLKSLNRKVYYTVIALDRRYNQSAFAPPVEIQKPDIIPPSAPVFSSYELKESGLLLKWVNSTDPDVASHSLYRKEISDTSTGWQKIGEMNDGAQQYTDKPGATDRTYAYTLIARDSAGLESPPAEPLTLFIPSPRQKEAVRRLDAEADRDKREIYLQWESVAANIIQFELYRAEDKAAMSLYQVFNADQKTFTDKELRANTAYKYAIRAIYRDGKYSDFKMKNIIY